MKPNVTDMKPELYDKYLKWKWMVNEGIGLQMVLTCVKRVYAEQQALFAQGRSALTAVNELRKLAGMSEISNRENQYKVTWTMKSKHFADPVDGKVSAFDFALLVPEKRVITWDTKWDLDHDGTSEYLECAKLAKECGLEAGGLWDTPDYPHIELRKG